MTRRRTTHGNTPTRSQSLSCIDARRLFLGAQGLLDDPERDATASTVEAMIRSLGFVQIDSINYVERAHHLTLGARLDDYRPRLLHDLLETHRSLFEHWTHDASAIPCDWFSHWHHRFDRFLERAQRSSWWKERLGEDPFAVMDDVKSRIEREGPLRSRDFAEQRTQPSQGWWDWKPQKVALEVLWRIGELAIARRENFQKVYDLTHRVLPELHAMEKSAHDEHVDWACSTALDRLGVATPTELAAFWHAVSAADCRAWCGAAEKAGRIVSIDVSPADGEEPLRAWAAHDWQQRVTQLAEPPDRMRLLSPFDPIIRDRKRLLRLFGYDYRFEAFVPEAKRVHGYYVMPILDGDRLVGRVDPKFDRASRTLQIRSVWWESKVRPTRQRRNRLEEAVNRLALLIGADHFELPTNFAK